MAAILGKAKVDKLLAKLTAGELTEWRAFLEMEPHGPARGDLQAGIIAACMVNQHRRKGQKARGPGDFLLVFDRDEKPKRKPTNAEREERMRNTLKELAEVYRRRRDIQVR